MSRLRLLLTAGVMFGVSTTFAPHVVAQPSSTDIATAQAMFDEGKRLMTAGKFAEACPKLVESQRIDPGGGTLYAIALCHEGEGKTATAWADFTLALSEARKDKRADRESAAAERIKALEPKLTRYKIAAPKGVEVKRDGALVGEVQWGVALPIDPGEHKFEASAPGKAPWTKLVDVRGEGVTVDVTIPELPDVPKVEAPPAATQPLPPPPPAREEPSMTTMRTVGLLLGGLGIVTTGVGVGFGINAVAKWDDVESACQQNRCPTQAKLDAARVVGRDAGTSADISTAVMTVGVVALVAGIALYVLGEGRGPGKPAQTAIR